MCLVSFFCKLYSKHVKTSFKHTIRSNWRKGNPSCQLLLRLLIIMPLMVQPIVASGAAALRRQSSSNSSIGDRKLSITTVTTIPPPEWQASAHHVYTPRGKSTDKVVSAFEKAKAMPWIIGSKIKVGEEQSIYQIGVRVQIFLTLEDPDSSLAAKVIAIFIMVLIVISTLSFVLSTLEQLSFQPSTCDEPVCKPSDVNAVCNKAVCEPEPDSGFGMIEVTCISLFTIEYLLRLFTVHAAPMMLIDYNGYLLDKYTTDNKATSSSSPPSFSSIERSGIRKTFWYFRQVINLIDLAAILPFYIALSTPHQGTALGFLRILRLSRLMRVFKLSKYSEGSSLFLHTMQKSASALTLLLFFMTIMIVVFGSLIYFFEQGTFKVTPEYPEGNYYRPTINGLGEEISPFQSIPLSFYWVVVTTATVGYGDFAPTTAWGRFTASLAAYVGILCIALPVTIVGTNFTAEYEALYGNPVIGRSESTGGRIGTPVASSSFSLSAGAAEAAAGGGKELTKGQSAKGMMLKSQQNTSAVKGATSSFSSGKFTFAFDGRAQEGADSSGHKQNTALRRRRKTEGGDGAGASSDRRSREREEDYQGLLRTMEELKRLELAVALVREQLHVATEALEDDDEEEEEDENGENDDREDEEGVDALSRDIPPPPPPPPPAS